MRTIKDYRDTARFWQAVCLVLTVAYAAGFIEHYFKGCNV